MADAGLLGGIGEGLSRFADSYMKARQMKDQEGMQQAGLLSQGIQKNDDGSYGLTPMKQKEQQAQGLSLQNEIDSADPQSNISKQSRTFHKAMIDKVMGNGQGDKFVTDDMSALDLQKRYGTELGDVIKGSYQAQGNAVRANALAGPREESVEFQKHKTAVDSVQNDKPTQELLNGYQSIQNALVEFRNNPSVQSFHTLQSTLRQNAGSANKSGVAERAEQYSKTTGMKADEIKQFIFGDPDLANVNLSDPKMVNAYMNVAKGELDQKRSQAHQQIDKKSGSFTSVYNKPSMKDYQKDFKNTVDAQKDQFKPTDELLGGDLGSTQFTPDVVNYAKKHGISNSAALAIKKKRGG